MNLGQKIQTKSSKSICVYLKKFIHISFRMIRYHTAKKIESK